MRRIARVRTWWSISMSKMLKGRCGVVVVLTAAILVSLCRCSGFGKCPKHPYMSGFNLTMVSVKERRRKREKLIEIFEIAFFVPQNLVFKTNKKHYTIGYEANFHIA